MPAPALAPRLLVSAGEPSADQLGAAVLQALGAGPTPPRALGLGGPALRAAGCELVAPLEAVSSMGLGGLPLRGARAGAVALRLLWAATRAPTDAALLVGTSELNAWLGRRLRALGVPVLWLAPPQVWAWRPGRARELARSADRLATLFPFEAAPWEAAGARVSWVGHPAADRVHDGRDRLRSRLGLAPVAEYVAVLPGSRPEELHRHLEVQLDAIDHLRAERGAVDARVLLASGLPRRTDTWARARCAARGVPPLAGGAAVLPAFDVALAASGTVTLECALAGVPPVILHRTDALTHAVARRLVTVAHIGLPNLVLGRRAFPELLQGAAHGLALAEEAGRLLDALGPARAECAAVRAALTHPADGGAPGGAAARVAAELEGWLAHHEGASQAPRGERPLVRALAC